MAGKLYVFDAMAFAFRAYYAIRTALTDAEGRPANAVFGFTRILLKLLREHAPSHVAVVFDAPGKTFRDEMYPGYKATRKETPSDLKEQFPRMHEVVEALNLALLVVPGVEADDVMATLARQAEAAGMETVLVTGDKDLLQLVSEKVKVFDPSKGDEGKWHGREEVVERFGVGPEHVIDALALIGDAADNVPGVRGIGGKTAKKLLERFGSLEGLYENLAELKGKQKEKILADRDQAFFSRELVTLKRDVPLDVTLDDLRRKEIDADRVTELFTTLAFHSMLEELGLAPEAAEEGPKRYKLVQTKAELEAAIAEMRANGSFAVDTETTSVDAMRADLVGVSMSCRAGTGYYVPLAHTGESLTILRDPDDLTSVERIEVLDKKEALALLRPLLEDPAVGKAGHNIKYDLLVLDWVGIRLAGITMDTMVASYLTDPSRMRHNLAEVGLQYLRHKLIPISDLLGKGSKTITFDEVPIDRACEYACEDADITWRLSEVFLPLLRDRQLESLFHEVEMPLVEILARVEKTGVAIDTALFAQLQSELVSRLGELEADIFELAGEPFNINSPKQLQGILFDKLGLEPVRKTKTGFSTNVDVLEQLAPKHPLPGKMLEYRTLEKLRGTYVEALPKLVHPRTGRIHTSFNQAVAATGRLSSSNPNLQNIPVRTELGRRIRAGFVPGDEGKCLISADYSQIELRILAHLSKDQNLIAAFEADADVHRETAARVFGVTQDEVTPEMRRQAKAVNFGVIYGMGAFGLAQSLGISNAEAARFIESYFGQYPRVRAWLDETVAQAKETGYVSTLLNRRRYLPELKSSDARTRRAGERIALNTPVQGSAADVIKLAMVRLDPALAEFNASAGGEGLAAQLILQVHDELVVEARLSCAEEVAGLMVRVMEAALPLDAPLKVDVGTGGNWAEIH